MPVKALINILTIVKICVMKDKYLTTAEAAKELGVSRVTVFNRIKAGTIKAERFGRGFAIPREEVINNKKGLSEEDKRIIEESVKRVVKDYGVALKMLGKE
jgi:excisionase family DNA binding protein